MFLKLVSVIPIHWFFYSLGEQALNWHLARGPGVLQTQDDKYQAVSFLNVSCIWTRGIKVGIQTTTLVAHSEEYNIHCKHYNIEEITEAFLSNSGQRTTLTFKTKLEDRLSYKTNNNIRDILYPLILRNGMPSRDRIFQANFWYVHKLFWHELYERHYKGL